MNFAQLEYLVAATHHTSFSEAAKALFVTPQAISKAMKELERELNVPLFVKNGREIRITRTAYRLASIAESMLHQRDAFQAIADSACSKDEPSEPGTITLAVATMADRGFALTERDVANVSQQLGALKLQLAYHASESCLDVLDANLTDAAIVLGHPSQSRQAHKVLLRRGVVLTSADNRLAERPALHIADLQDVPLAPPSNIRDEHRIISAAFENEDIEPLFTPCAPAADELAAFLSRGGALIALPNSPIPNRIPNVTVIPFAPGEGPVFPFYLVTSGSMQPHARQALQRALMGIADGTA